MQTHCDRLAYYCPFAIGNVQDTRNCTNLHVFSEALRPTVLFQVIGLLNHMTDPFHIGTDFPLSNVIDFYFKINQSSTNDHKIGRSKLLSRDASLKHFSMRV